MKTAVAERIAHAFNNLYPVGTLCEYWTGGKCEEPSGKARIRYEATVLGGHTPVVWLEGVRSCIALTHVRPIEDDPLSAEREGSRQ